MPSTLGPFLRHRRQRFGLTQAQLAERVGEGTRQEHISRLERGAVTLPRWHRLLALAEVLEVTPGTLLLRAGLITTEDVQRSAGTSGRPPSVREFPAREEVRPPIGVVHEWETAAIFTCA
jgi:transcriptional regulator with XRE-family HTH domain